MNIIPLSEHPSNNDRTAHIVAEDRSGDWTVYSAKGGYVLTLKGGLAVEGAFQTQAEALTATDRALELCLLRERSAFNH